MLLLKRNKGLQLNYNNKILPRVPDKQDLTKRWSSKYVLTTMQQNLCQKSETSGINKRVILQNMLLTWTYVIPSKRNITNFEFESVNNNWEVTYFPNNWAIGIRSCNELKHVVTQDNVNSLALLDLNSLNDATWILTGNKSSSFLDVS